MNPPRNYLGEAMAIAVGASAMQPEKAHVAALAETLMAAYNAHCGDMAGLPLASFGEWLNGILEDV